MSGFLPPFGPPNRRAQDLILRVEEVQGRYDRGQFAGVANRIYRWDRRWMPPIRSIRANALLPQRNPLLAGSDLGAFLGTAQNLGLGDETVGAIAAWSAPAQDEYEGSWGAWGGFESINAEDMVERLFGEAEMWLFEHAGAMVGTRGPLPLELLSAPGLLTDGFDVESAALLPYNPPYYPEMVEAQEYERAVTWRAYRLDLPSTSQPNASGTRVSGEDWGRILVAHQAAGEERAQSAQLVAGLDAWLAHLAGEEPMTTSWAWRQTVGRAFDQAIAVVTGDEAEGIGACFAIPELRPAFRLAAGRLLPFGWLMFRRGLRRTQQVRIFPAAAPEDWDSRRLADLYGELARAAAAAGYRSATIAPILDEDEKSRDALSLLRARPVQRFSVYEKRF